MVLYFIYWLASKLPYGEVIKLITLFFLCFLVSMVIYISPIKNYHSIWLKYTIVFPAGVLFSKYKTEILILLSNKIKNQFLVLIPIFISLIIFYKWNQLIPINSLQLIRPLALLLPIILFFIIYEKLNLQSTFLMFIGSYSLEIYLLHIPFMVKYDFILFRKPLYISFFVYFSFLLFFSYLLAQASIIINERLVSGDHKKYNK